MRYVTKEELIKIGFDPKKIFVAYRPVIQLAFETKQAVSRKIEGNLEDEQTLKELIECGAYLIIYEKQPDESIFTNVGLTTSDYLILRHF